MPLDIKPIDLSKIVRGCPYELKEGANLSGFTFGKTYIAPDNDTLINDKLSRCNVVKRAKYFTLSNYPLPYDEPATVEDNKKYCKSLTSVAPGLPFMHGGVYQFTILDDGRINVISGDNTGAILSRAEFEMFFDLCDVNGVLQFKPEVDNVNNPAHYKGANGIESIDVIEGFGLNFNTGNAVKYILRAGRKDTAKHKEDLEKAIWYLKRELSYLS
jgi:hypothetical protein